MSTSNKQSEDSADGEPQVQAPDVPDAPSSRPAARVGLAGLAVVLALLALVASGWVWYSGQRDSDAPSPMQVELDARAGELASAMAAIERLEGRLEAMESAASELESLAGASAVAERKINELASELDDISQELGEQIQSLWQREGEQRQADHELERRMLMLEAASLLRLGQERAELASDWSSARAAYRRASDLLQQVDDPRLGGVRRELARELDSLEAIDAPDWLRLQTRLERLAGQSTEWPRRPLADDPGPADGEAAEGGDDAGWLSSARSALAGLVRVSPRDEMALSDSQVDALREQFRLRLAAAEMAAARRDSAELAHHLQSAQRQMDIAFDPEDRAVAEALTLISELQQQSLAEVPVGLGRALAALRDLLAQS
jgi:uroporphyrin-III C-methyltransferase